MYYRKAHILFGDICTYMKI